MLLLHGEEDSVCPVRASREFFEQLIVPGKRLHTYARLRHEIFNEPERDEVLSDVVNWMRSIDSGSEQREIS
jgi:lysophospholipase